MLALVLATLVATQDGATERQPQTQDTPPAVDAAPPTEPEPAAATTPAPMTTPAPPAPATTPAPPAAAAAAPVKCSMAVLDLEAADGISKSLAATWTDVVVQEMQAHSGCTVLSRADIRAVISLEAEKSLLGCDEQSCLSELGGALGVSHLVTGRISRIEGSVLLSLRKTNLKTMVVESRATDSFGGYDDEVFAFVSWLSRKLVLTDPALIGAKPVPGPKRSTGPQLVERRGTVWRTLAWTGVWLTAASAVTFGAGAITTEILSNQTEAAKLEAANNRDFLQMAEQVGPISASVTNGALYAGAGLLVVTVALFFLPHEEIARVDIDQVQMQDAE